MGPTGEPLTVVPADNVLGANEKEPYLVFSSPPPPPRPPPPPPPHEDDDEKKAEEAVEEKAVEAKAEEAAEEAVEAKAEEAAEAGSVSGISGGVHPTVSWLGGLRQRLTSGGAVPTFTLDRGATVYRASGAGPGALAGRFNLPSDFYRLTAEEVRREQMRRTQDVEKASVLRTRAMRERENDLERPPRQYLYCLLRVRMPDGVLLQGTFGVTEAVCRVYDFVRDCLAQQWLPFSLLGPRGNSLPNDQDTPLSRTGLVPSALLTFVLDPDVYADILSASPPPSSSASSSSSSSCATPCCLKAELMERCLTLS
ncbi:uncharacterized protein LOC142922605 [Petromyzon marinus]|uniref:uncharacterized protein LOC142922605 n=1 Tax=Petromyzon marinus TaxID=7757 RepID=UPI003F72F346